MSMSYMFYLAALATFVMGTFGLICDCPDLQLTFNRRIVGGMASLQHEYPFIVGLYSSPRSREPFCGGVLVSDQHVLTAAHCIKGPYRVWGVSVCDHRLSDVRDGGYMVRIQPYKRDAVVHPKYDYNQTVLQYDLAVLKLQRPLRRRRGSSCPRPICLPNSASNITKMSSNFGLVAGWGVTESKGAQSRTLMHAKLPILSNDMCKTVYGQRIGVQHICAGGQGMDTCQGDSGGPLFAPKNNNKVKKKSKGEKERKNVLYELLALTSFGLGCGLDDVPGGYARVDQMLHFIHIMMGQKSPCHE